MQSFLRKRIGEIPEQASFQTSTKQSEQLEYALCAGLMLSMILFIGCGEQNRSAPNLNNQPATDQPIVDEEPFASNEGPDQENFQMDEETNKSTRVAKEEEL